MKIKRFSKYSKDDNSIDPNVHLSVGEKLLDSGKKVKTYKWTIPRYKTKVDIEGSTESYKKSYKKQSLTNQERIDDLEQEIEDGYIFDNPPGNPLKSRTHCLGERSHPNSPLKQGRSIICTKDITKEDRLNYKVGYPYPDDNNKRTYIFPVVLQGCEEHKIHGGKFYSDLSGNIYYRRKL